MTTANRIISGLEIRAPAAPSEDAVLAPPALEFVADLARRFGGRVEELRARRRQRQARFDAGERPRFLAETAAVRESAWTGAPLPADRRDRRVEITGPVDRKMKGPNQIHVTRDDVRVTAEDLLRAPQGTRTEAGLRHNIRVGVQYLESWLRGLGCVPQMEGLPRSPGRSRFDGGRFREAADLLDRMSTSEALEEFLTLPACESLP